MARSQAVDPHRRKIELLCGGIRGREIEGVESIGAGNENVFLRFVCSVGYVNVGFGELWGRD